MECACIDVISDGEPVSNYRKKTIKTRKEHKCYECDHIIQKGEECEYVEFRFYKENYRIWTCKDCLSVIKAFFCGHNHGSMWEDLYEYLSPGECLDKAMLEITEVARFKILEIIEPQI